MRSEGRSTAGADPVSTRTSSEPWTTVAARFIVVAIHGDPSWKGTAAAMIALFAIPAAGAAPLVTPALALIDVGLVLTVFKGDVRLS